MLRRTLFRAASSAEKKSPTLAEQYSSAASSALGQKSASKTSLYFSVEMGRPGSLVDALGIFKKNNVNMSHLSTRHVSDCAKFVTVFADLTGSKGDANVQQAIEQLGKEVSYVNVIGSWTIPWFPRHMSDLDKFEQKVMAAGAELIDDPENPHPGFHDEVYKQRRRMICEAASTYKHGMEIPRHVYTKDEITTWGAIWDKLTALYATHACQEFNYIFPLLVENCGYSRNNIPQLQDVSAYLESRTGWSLRPVAGLLSPRDFLAGLAFRVFHSTQYLRHHSKPFYTPEPDIVHELMGHVPMFADPDFADFSQTLGLASLGASDEDIKRLAATYWFTVEFGMCKQGGATKAYGAGVLSSFGELEYSHSSEPKMVPFDPYVAATTPYPITKYQPMYFVAQSFRHMKQQMQEYAASIDRPFILEFNPYQKTVIQLSKNRDTK